MGALVADASAIIRVLASVEPTTPFDRYFVPEADLHAPAACDVEVVATLAGAVKNGTVGDEDARMALLDYTALPIKRHGHVQLVGRAYTLRHNFSVSDAMYVALAEALGADLVTADARLARAARRHTSLRVLP